MKKAINMKNVNVVTMEYYDKEAKTLSLLMALTEGSSYLKEKAGTEFMEYLEETAGEILYDLGYEDGDQEELTEVMQLLSDIVEDILSDYLHFVEC